MGVLDKRRQVKATIVRIWEQGPPGGPWYYWIYVLFDTDDGERIKIHLKKSQAKKFTDVSAEGDTGYLDFKGDRMYSWERAG